MDHLKSGFWQRVGINSSNNKKVKNVDFKEAKEILKSLGLRPAKDDREYYRYFYELLDSSEKRIEYIKKVGIAGEKGVSILKYKLVPINFEVPEDKI